MSTLHTFGCSITQGFALPDLVRPITDHHGQPLTGQQIRDLDRPIDWQDIHVYEPSQFAWPAVLARLLDLPVHNHARRGACFNQIARQCVLAAPTIRSQDTVIVMWTYLSRISLQWPARTAVPFCNLVDPAGHGWRTLILGFNKWFGLDRADQTRDDRVLKYIHDSTRITHLDPLGVYDRYYNHLVLQITVDGLLQSTGARVIHLSVEPESYLDQLETARLELEPSLQAPYQIPDPRSWYTLDTDHHSCRVILDPSIPPAENDMHPSCQHHQNFADHLRRLYFSG
jgi:hypothetical protein